MLLSLALFVSLFSGLSAFACPNGTISIPGQHLCVAPIRQADDYSNAIRQCNGLGGDVVQVSNVLENAILFGLIGSDFNGSSAFIGVEKSATGTWVYSDGSVLNYTNWAPGQPSKGDCAAIGPDTNKWHSVTCETALPYFCGLDGDALQCPSGWVYLPETDHCYFLQNFTTPDSVHWQLYNWTTAEMDCQNMGAHLASIHSKFENEFIYKWIYYDGPTVNGPVPNTCDYSVVWIGLTGTLGSDSKWSDGTFYDFRDPNAKPTGLKTAKWAAHAGACTGGMNGAHWDSNTPADVYGARYICKKESLHRPLMARLGLSSKS